MRIAGWRAKGIFDGARDAAVLAAQTVMYDVAATAKGMVPIGTITREGYYQYKQVSFTPHKGRRKEIPVSFMAMQWQGRIPGSLQESIRTVIKEGRPGNVRVYAGHHRTYYAHMVERGTAKTPAHPFIRPAFKTVTANAKERMSLEIKKVIEANR